MLSHRVSRLPHVIVFAFFVGACSSTVGSSSTPDAGAPPQDVVSRDVAPDAPTCACPTGRCGVGASWRDTDGCNTCTCSGQDQVGCTLIACVDAGPRDVSTPTDTGARVCRSNAECGFDQVCEYEPGCPGTGAGTCVSNGCQSLPVAPIYCGCDGREIQAVSACRPDRAYSGMGRCPSADAGPGRRHPDAVMVWQSPGGVAGWGPALRVTGDGTIRLWRLRTGFSLDTPDPAPDRTVTVSGSDVDQLFDLWSMVNTRALPHTARGGDCYPSVSVRLCRSCTDASIRYTVPTALLPEMEMVWGWFDGVLGVDSPRRYCAF